MGLLVETPCGFRADTRSKKLILKNGNGYTTNTAMLPVKTSHTGSPELLHQKSYRRPVKTSGTPQANCLVTFPPCRSHRGKHVENQKHHHGNTSGLRKAQYFWNRWVHHCSRKTVSATSLIRGSSASFPNVLFFRILTKRFSGFEKDVSSFLDGFSAWVKTDP